MGEVTAWQLLRTLSEIITVLDLQVNVEPLHTAVLQPNTYLGHSVSNHREVLLHVFRYGSKLVW